MKRRLKPERSPAGQRPPCGFKWLVDPEDGHLFSSECACGRQYSQHERYKEIWPTMAIAEVGAEAMRKQVAHALAHRIPVRERIWPLRTGVLENGQRWRYPLEAADTEEPTN